MLPAKRAPQSFVIHTTPVITAVQVPPTLLLQSGLLLSSGLCFHVAYHLLSLL